MAKVMFDLESVGTGIALDGMCYPMLDNGKYDYEAGSHISEGDEEWQHALSEENKKVVDWISHKIRNEENNAR